VLVEQGLPHQLMALAQVLPAEAAAVRPQLVVQVEPVVAVLVVETLRVLMEQQTPAVVVVAVLLQAAGIFQVEPAVRALLLLLTLILLEPQHFQV
jgi:hypothetical protein